MKNNALILLILTMIALSSCTYDYEKGEVFSYDGLLISYEKHGSGDTALVFVHGWCCDKSYWEKQLAFFKDNYTVITVDYGGHGESGSDRKRWKVESFGKDVAAVVRSLQLDNVILIGHSMGGEINMFAARELPGRVLALVGADTYHDIAYQYDTTAFLKFIKPFVSDFKSATGSFVRGMFPQNADSALVEKIANDMSSANQRIAVEAMTDYTLNNNKPLLEEIREVPMFAINTDRWPVQLGSNRLYVDHFKLRFMPGLGHFVMLEDPEQFNKLLQETIYEIGK